MTGLAGAGLIAAERARQRSAEGYDDAHDDAHTTGEIASAAACYAIPLGFMVERGTFGSSIGEPPLGWPWEPAAWKPSADDRIRELVKAGALIAAEIDRLLRAEAKRTGTARTGDHLPCDCSSRHWQVDAIGGVYCERHPAVSVKRKADA